jgi:hypothetical protein
MSVIGATADDICSPRVLPFDPTRTLAFARTARHAVKGRAEATRFKGRFSELIVALIKLAALQVRLGTIATEAAWTFHSKVIQVSWRWG